MMNEASVTMNISLPEPLKRYVDDKVATGIYGSASEAIRVLHAARDLPAAFFQEH